MLFVAHSINKGMQSSSVKSYFSAINRTLLDDGYPWDDNKVLISSLTRACKIVNDKLRTRLPIKGGLLELILFGLQRKFEKGGKFLSDYPIPGPICFRFLWTNASG